MNSTCCRRPLVGPSQLSHLKTCGQRNGRQSAGRSVSQLGDHSTHSNWHLEAFQRSFWSSVVGHKNGELIFHTQNTHWPLGDLQLTRFDEEARNYHLGLTDWLAGSLAEIIWKRRDRRRRGKRSCKFLLANIFHSFAYGALILTREKR